MWKHLLQLMSIHAVFDTQGMACSSFRQRYTYRSFVFRKGWWSPWVFLYCTCFCSAKQGEWLGWFHMLSIWVVQLTAAWHSCSCLGQHVSSTLLQSSYLAVEKIFLLFQWSVFGHPLKRNSKSLEFELTGLKNSRSWKGGWVISRFIPAVTKHIQSQI